MEKMSDSVAYNFAHGIMSEIENARNIQCLKNIESNENLRIIIERNFNNYPKIEFKIDADDIKSLIDIKKYLVKNENKYNFTNLLSQNNSNIDAITKLLYAFVWKNGDLTLIDKIIQGIMDASNNESNINHETGLVFYQFGRYLTKVEGEPIVDQHIIRAFIVSTLPNYDEIKINEFRKKDGLKKTDLLTIQKYKKWITTLKKNFQSEESNFFEYSYFIDRILFATGKFIKK